MSGESRAVQVSFQDNALLTELFGEHNRNLHQIERILDVAVTGRGNTLSIAGESAPAARKALSGLYHMLESGQPIGESEVEAALRMAGIEDADPIIQTPKRQVRARSIRQAEYITALQTHPLTFGIGPAGTGKTYLAVAAAASELKAGAIERIVLSRPAVEAGEHLGFLPGDLRNKIDPYLRPLHDALDDLLPRDWVSRRMDNGVIEIAPLAFMRGRTLANAFVILDEAQNATPVQMKMFLTRLGEGARMAVTGDLSQVDLPTPSSSGLDEALRVTAEIEGVAHVHFNDTDVVRPRLVGDIVRSYERNSNKRPHAKGKG